MEREFLRGISCERVVSLSWANETEAALYLRVKAGTRMKAWSYAQSQSGDSPFGYQR